MPQLANPLTMRAPFVLYTAVLATGVLADIALCSLTNLRVFWYHFLPGIYYVGILFAAITFGTAGGVGAASVAGICHTATGLLCRQPVSERGELVVFGLIAITAGWLTHPVRTFQKPRQSPGVVKDTSAEHDRNDSELINRLAAIDPLRAGLIHELRTPVASIEGAAFLLDDDKLADDKRQEFLGIVRRECHRLELLLATLDSKAQRSSSSTRI